MSGALLETEALGRHFGGLAAVDGVSIEVERGEIRAIIGPNGAGKTTLVGMVSGRVRPSEGRIRFDGRDITRAAPWTRVGAGIVYTFQVTSIFGALSVRENVALAAQRRMMRGPRGWMRLDGAALDARVERALGAVDMDAHAARRADELPYGHQRLLEVAMGLALEPRLLILDEPTQGLAEHEIETFCARVREIAAHATVMLIEHNMKVVLSLASRITVMDRGRVIADGDPASVEANEDVQRAYLGPVMLELKAVRAGYGRIEILHGVDLALESGEVLGLLGRNGAGKTTTIRAIMGLVDSLAGSIRLDGAELVGLPAHEVPGHGLAYVPQGRRLFPEMSVEENLRMGLLAGTGDPGERMDYVLELFPVLKERLRAPARALSGGQQQMVAMGRALATGPRVLLLDEPSEGLQPSLVDRILETISDLRATGVAMLLVEQKVEAALRVADRIAFIENGRVVEHASAAALADDPGPLVRYVGVHRG